MGYFGVDKTLNMLKSKIYWPHIGANAQRHCRKCLVCLQAKSKLMPHGLYTPLPIAKSLWEDINMDFILRLHFRTYQNSKGL